MPYGNTSLNNEIRSGLLKVLIESRVNQNNVFEKYEISSNELSEPSNNNSFILWEIIYFVAEGNLVGRNISVSDIYLSLNVSKSTAIRCVATLRNLGILQKSRDPEDRRRAVITLSDEFRVDFIEYLDAILSQLRTLPET